MNKILSVIIIFCLLGLGLYAYKYKKLEEKYNLQVSESKEKSEIMDSIINELQIHLASSTAENRDLNDFLTIMKARNLDSANALQEVNKQVNEMRKLEETDHQLLEKYSKIYFLNENYTPAELSTIDSKFLFVSNKPVQIETHAKSYLEALIRAARADNIDLSVLSGYRSFGTQAALKSQYKVTYGAGTANSFSADQGYSEHQLGTTIDFTTKETGIGLNGFEKTPAYTWLNKNAYKYGFVLSYPNGNAYYIFEPWHWRFVGVALAEYLHGQHMNFYDMPQRDIDTYLIKIFD